MDAAASVTLDGHTLIGAYHTLSLAHAVVLVQGDGCCSTGLTRLNARPGPTRLCHVPL